MNDLPNWLDQIPLIEGTTPDEFIDLTDEVLMMKIQGAAMVLRDRVRWRKLWAAIAQAIQNRLGDDASGLWGDLLETLQNTDGVAMIEHAAWTELHASIPTKPVPGATYRKEWFDWLLRLEALLVHNEDDGEGDKAEPPAPDGAELQEAPPSPEPTIPGPRKSPDVQAANRLGEILDRLSSPEDAAPIRLGIDFGTSLSKIISRSMGDEAVLHERTPIGEALPSAITLGKNDGSIYFGQEALDHYDQEPEQHRIWRSLKRVLLSGRASGIANIDRRLTTAHVSVFSFAWLYQQARLMALGAPLNGELPWLDTHMTMPVTGPHSELRPFWLLQTESEKVKYQRYLGHLAIAGAALSAAFDGDLPSTWRDLEHPFQRLCTNRDQLQAALRRRLPGTTSEPLAATWEHGPYELGEGWHLVVDSGAGTTDWTVILVHGNERIPLAEGSTPFGGDDVDEAMLELARAEIDADVGKGFDQRILIEMSRAKAEMFSNSFIEFNPALLLPGASGTLPVDIRADDVVEKIRPDLVKITDGIRKSLHDADDRVANAGDRLRRLDIPMMRMDRLHKVHLLGGTSAVPAVVDAVGAGLNDIRNKPKVELLAIPSSEAQAARTDANRFRISAVALGASKKDLPSCGLIETDTPVEQQLDPWDKDAG